MLPRRKWFKFALYFGALITVGSMGFYSIGMNDSLYEWSLIDSIYMTIITLSTVGFSETHPLSEGGKLWAIMVIIFGASGFAVLLSEFGNEFMEMNTFRRKKMNKKVLKMKDHYVICGYGRMGAVIASELMKKRIPFVIVEQSNEKIEQIEDKGFKFVQNDATLDDTLINAGIENAKGAVVVLDNDPDNLFVTMSARNLNADAYIISRCVKHDTGKKLKRAGANKVVNPYISGGHRMADLLISPLVEDTVSLETKNDDFIDLSIEEFAVEHLQSIDGKSIAESRFREEYGLLIVGIVKDNGESEINPGSDFILSSGQKIMVIGSNDDLLKMNEALSR
jgi:voltage-gated potassium channel